MEIFFCIKFILILYLINFCVFCYKINGFLLVLKNKKYYILKMKICCRFVFLLKDCDILEIKVREFYLECIYIIRILYYICRLIYVDFSEFNML